MIGYTILRWVGLTALYFWPITPAHSQQERTIQLSKPTAITPAEFNRVSSVRELRDGSLLVSDQGDDRLILVRWSPVTLTVLGRSGDGPNEYRTIGWLYPLAGDATLLTDGYRNRWLMLVGGRIVRTLVESRPLNQLLRSKLLGADLKGHVAGTIGFYFVTGPRLRETADSLLLLRGVIATEKIDTIARLRGHGGLGWQVTPPSGGRMGLVVAHNPLALEDQALLLPDGWIAVVRAEPYGIAWYNPAGRLTAARTLPFEAIELDNREKCFALTWLGPQEACDPSARKAWPKTIPPFVQTFQAWVPALFALPDGSLAIARTPRAATPGNVYDMVNREGRRFATLKLAREEMVIGFGSSAMYVVHTDPATGEQSIRRHEWH